MNLQLHNLTYTTLTEPCRPLTTFASAERLPSASPMPEEVARGVVPSHQSAPLVLERFYARLNRGITSALPLSASR